MKPKPRPIWRGDVNTEVVGRKFTLTMDEVEELLTELAAAQEPEPEPPPAAVGQVCAHCGRDLPPGAFYQRCEPGAREYVCKECQQKSKRRWRKRESAGGYAK